MSAMFSYLLVENISPKCTSVNTAHREINLTTPNSKYFLKGHRWQVVRLEMISQKAIFLV
jgi:hypothetical protein